jgi:cell shape-determining protein MreC
VDRPAGARRRGDLGDYIYLVHVKRENDRLTAENARLRAEAARHRAEFEENRRLRRLLQLRVETPGEVYAAEVIARTRRPSSA